MPYQTGGSHCEMVVLGLKLPSSIQHLEAVSLCHWEGGGAHRGGVSGGDGDVGMILRLKAHGV